MDYKGNSPTEAVQLALDRLHEIEREVIIRLFFLTGENVSLCLFQTGIIIFQMIKPI